MPSQTELAYERLHLATMRSSPVTQTIVKVNSRDLMLVLAELNILWYHRERDWQAEACVDAIRGMRARGEFSGARLDAILRVFSSIGEASPEDLEIAAVDRQAVIDKLQAKTAQEKLRRNSHEVEKANGLGGQVRAEHPPDRCPASGGQRQG